MKTSYLTDSFIYLDYNATTPCDPQVLEGVMPYWSTHFANAASNTYSMGLYAANAVKIARQQVAKLVSAEESEIIFTSGATESCNIAIRGVAKNYQYKGKHIITAGTEHKAVLDTCSSLELEGYEITYLPVNTDGSIDVEILKNSIREDTILIALMYANNETGLIHPVKEIGAIAKEKNVLFFCDATQALGKIPINVLHDNIDLMALSAHKIYALKGTGALYIRRKNPRVQIPTFLTGGGHEKNIRSGTLNVPGIVAMGLACRIIFEQLGGIQAHFNRLRAQLLEGLLSIPHVVINGNKDSSLPNTINVSFLFTEGKIILQNLRDKIGISAGSACTAHLNKPSYVLLAMGLSENRAASSFRFSLGRNNTEEEIKSVIEIVKTSLEEVRSESYIWKRMLEENENLDEWK